MTDPLGKMVKETGDELITTKSKSNNNKYNMVIHYKNWKKYNEIQFKKMDSNNLNMKNHPPSDFHASFYNSYINTVTFNRVRFSIDEQL